MTPGDARCRFQVVLLRVESAEPGEGRGVLDAPGPEPDAASAVGLTRSSVRSVKVAAGAHHGIRGQEEEGEEGAVGGGQLCSGCLITSWRHFLVHRQQERREHRHL